MGDKSPKATQKTASQKASKAKSENDRKMQAASANAKPGDTKKK